MPRKPKETDLAGTQPRDPGQQLSDQVAELQANVAALKEKVDSWVRPGRTQAGGGAK